MYDTSQLKREETIKYVFCSSHAATGEDSSRVYCLLLRNTRYISGYIWCHFWKFKTTSHNVTLLPSLESRELHVTFTSVAPTPQDVTLAPIYNFNLECQYRLNVERHATSFTYVTTWLTLRRRTYYATDIRTMGTSRHAIWTLTNAFKYRSGVTTDGIISPSFSNRTNYAYRWRSIVATLDSTFWHVQVAQV